MDGFRATGAGRADRHDATCRGTTVVNSQLPERTSGGTAGGLKKPGGGENLD